MSAEPGVRMLLSGDALITRRYEPRADPDFLQLLQSCDVRFTNLEMLLNDYQGTPAVEAGGLHLSASPAIGRDLLQTSFNLFATANNHSLDFGTDGLEAHLEAVRQLDMTFAGTGAGLGEASEPAYLDTPNGRIALISCASSFATGQRAGARRGDFGGRPGLNPQRIKTTYQLSNERYDQLASISDELGVAAMNQWSVEMEFRKQLDDPEKQMRFVGTTLFGETVFEKAGETRIKTEPHEGDLQRNLANIEHARRQADIVIVSIHAHEADIEFDKPAEFLGTFGRACIDAGADIVTGSGPHVMRGIEMYAGKPIFYSLGNLWFEFETVNRVPSDSYEMHHLDGQALTPADLYDNALLGFHKDIRYWECAIPICTINDGNLNSIDLHCMSLAQDEPRGRRGTPRSATYEDAERILSYVSDLSKPFGTEIAIQDGIGTIKL